MVTLVLILFVASTVCFLLAVLERPAQPTLVPLGLLLFVLGEFVQVWPG